MKKIVLCVVVLLVAALIGAYFYVAGIDWNLHKDKIAEQFYNSTGKNISFEGNVSFKLLPSPYLKAEKVIIFDNKNADGKPLLNISKMMAELALIPLLKGEVVITRMELDGATVNIDWDNGGLNWQTDLSPDQRQMMEDANMVLDSVSLKNATVNVEAKEAGISFQLENLSGEVSAQSVFGPFRIEGNYLKGSSPQGFAITVGKLSESFATTLNAVVTNPNSESYVRFDGSFHLGNKVLNGNAIIESKKIATLVNDNLNKPIVPEGYNKPLALGFDVVLNPQNVNLSNIVVKYGETQGAGVMQIPLGKSENDRIVSKFEFANLELDGIKDIIKGLFDVENIKDDDKIFDFEKEIDAEIAATRAMYDGQGFKKFRTNLHIGKQIIEVNNFEIDVPGETKVRFSGSVFPQKGELFYEADVAVAASDLMTTLNWLKIAPKANVTSVYKRMVLDAKVAGTADKIQVSPFKMVLDKSTFEGELGVALGDKKDVMLVVNADTVNLDNYISALPEEQKALSWVNRMKYRVLKLGFLNDFDLVLDAKANLIIYEGMPFEKVDVKGNTLNGRMEIEYAKIEQVANAAINLKGGLIGFGKELKMEGLQYEFATDDLTSVINKLDLKVANRNYKNFNKVTSSGTIHGTFDDLSVNNLFAFGDLNGSYQGQILQDEKGFSARGAVSLKHPELSRLLESLNKQSWGDVVGNGLFKADANVVLSPNRWEFANADVNVGYNQFSGKVIYDNSGKRPDVEVELSAKKIELDRLLAKEKQIGVANFSGADEKQDFLAKPFWKQDNFDFGGLVGNNIKGSLQVGELLVGKNVLADSRIVFEIVDDIAKIKDFSALYKGAPLEVSGELGLIGEKDVAINFNLPDVNAADFDLRGAKYGLRSGSFRLQGDVSSKATNMQSLMSNLSGKVIFGADNNFVDGIDLDAIHEDLLKRTSAEGLVEKIRSNVGKGSSLANAINGVAVFDKGKFELENAVIDTPLAKINVFGRGDIENWSMDVNFNVKYNNPEYLPKYGFSLKNGMDNPTVDIDVSELYALYKSQEEQQKAAHIAEIEAENKEWKERVEQQKKTADDLVVNIREKIEKEIQAKREKVLGQKAIAKLEVLKQEVARLLADLVEETDKVNVEERNEEALQKLTDLNNRVMAETEGSEQKIQEIYFADLMEQNDADRKAVMDKYAALRKETGKSMMAIRKYEARMKKLDANYSIENDMDVKEYRNNIQSQIAEGEKEVMVANSMALLSENNPTIEEYEMKNAEMLEAKQKMIQKTDKLEQMVDDFADFLEERAQKFEDNFALQQQEKENKRKLEENVGSISVKRTGVKRIITRDINEIEKTEQEINNYGVKVLDFSKENVEQKDDDNKAVGGVIKKGRKIILN